MQSTKKVKMIADYKKGKYTREGKSNLRRQCNSGT
jgi:hypothetical protein